MHSYTECTATRSTFELENNRGQTVHSHLLITSSRKVFAKVRLTFLEAGGQEWQDSVRLLLGWLRAVVCSEGEENFSKRSDRE